MKTKHLRHLQLLRHLLGMCILTLLAMPCHATSISFVSGNGLDDGNVPVSGNGAVWGDDSTVRFLPYGTSDVANVPTQADFDAITGYQSYSVTSLPATIAPADTNGWGAFSGNMQAMPVFNFFSKNILDDPGASALFGIPIDIPSHAVDSAMLNFNYIVDNFLGFIDDQGVTIAEGLYWNGTPLTGTARHDPAERFMSGTITVEIPAELVLAGETNWLFMNVTDHLPAAGIVFAGTVSTTNPEPSTILIWSLLGMTGFGIARWRRRK